MAFDKNWFHGLRKGEYTRDRFGRQWFVEATIPVEGGPPRMVSLVLCMRGTLLPEETRVLRFDEELGVATSITRDHKPVAAFSDDGKGLTERPTRIQEPAPISMGPVRHPVTARVMPSPQGGRVLCGKDRGAGERDDDDD